MNLLLAPILLPLAVAAATLVTPRAAQRVLSVAGALLLLVVNLTILVLVDSGDGVAVLQVARWPAPAGITLVADRLAAMMLAITGFIGLAVALYSLGEIRRRKERFGYHALLQVLLMGVCGAFLAGDLFNLYVWYEVMLMASFVLLTLGGRRSQLEGAMTYVTLNLVSSALFLAALGVLYGLTGTLNLADLADAVTQVDRPHLLAVVAMMFLVAFALKAGAFPLFFWLPASYPTPPTAITAIFSALLTKVGVYSLIRLYTLVLVQDVGWTHILLIVIAGCTMLSGVLGAAVQRDVRRILSFHIVSQIGYLLMGLALAGPIVALIRRGEETQASGAKVAAAAVALSGTVFFMAHIIFSKTALFFVCGLIERLRRSAELERLGGLAKSHPVLAVAFFVGACSLAGIPPLAGFWAKFILVNAGLRTEAWIVTTAALVTGLFTLFSMTKIWTEAFWKPLAPGEAHRRDRVLLPSGRVLMYGPTLVMTAVVLLIGVFPAPMEAFAARTASQLIDPTPYIEAVMSDSLVRDSSITGEGAKGRNGTDSSANEPPRDDIDEGSSGGGEAGDAVDRPEAPAVDGEQGASGVDTSPRAVNGSSRETVVPAKRAPAPPQRSRPQAPSEGGGVS